MSRKKTNASKGTFGSLQRSFNSWKWILLSLLLIFPLGFWTLLQRLEKEPDKRFHNGIVILVTGLLLAVPGFYLTGRAVQTSWDSVSAYLKALTDPVIILFPGICLTICGSYYLALGMRDRNILRLIRTRQIDSLDDLCLIRGTSLPRLCDHLEAMKEYGLLPDVTMHYSRHHLSVYDPSGKLFSLYVSDSGFSSPAQYQKEDRDIPTRLWIGGAILGVMAGYFLLPAGLILSIIAIVFELRRKPRVNRIILNCAFGTFMFPAFMLLTTGLNSLRGHAPDPPGYLPLKAYAPCLIMPLFEIAAYCFLALRARRKARIAFLKKADPGLSAEEVAALCGKFKE